MSSRDSYLDNLDIFLVERTSTASPSAQYFKRLIQEYFKRLIQASSHRELWTILWPLVKWREYKLSVIASSPQQLRNTLLLCSPLKNEHEQQQFDSSAVFVKITQGICPLASKGNAARQMVHLTRSLLTRGNFVWGTQTFFMMMIMMKYIMMKCLSNVLSSISSVVCLVVSLLRFILTFLSWAPEERSEMLR